MKKFLKISALAVVMATFGFASCGDDDDKEIELTEKEKELQVINESFLKKNIIPVYKSLADEAILLRDAMEKLQNDKTEANLTTVCNYWFSARKYWEWSEAFLYGPADEYDIDPHIDTWPADIPEIEAMVSDEAKLNNIQQHIFNNVDGLAGFHGLEYILFRSGSKRAVSEIGANELRFAVGVAKDLALSCCRLEAAWSGRNNIAQKKQDILADFDVTDDADDFGGRLVNGYDRNGDIQGSTSQIIDGFIEIVNEVGAGKIGTAHNGEDVGYIESPHAYNSIQDFEDNISGVMFGYFGAVNATSAEDESISSYLTKINSDVDRKIIDAINHCIAKIQAMPKPFVLNYTDPKCGDAIEACEALEKAFEEAKRAIEQQD
jgi:hypothetical protein